MVAAPLPQTRRTWPAPAKINLFLQVVGKRDDGYHLLQTIFQFLDFGDELSFSITDDGSISRCLLYTSPSPRDGLLSRMPSSA